MRVEGAGLAAIFRSETPSIRPQPDIQVIRSLARNRVFSATAVRPRQSRTEQSCMRRLGRFNWHHGLPCLSSRTTTERTTTDLIAITGKYVTKEELRAELERQANRFKNIYGGEVITYAAQPDPERKPWRKKPSILDQAFQQELEKIEKERSEQNTSNSEFDA